MSKLISARRLAAVLALAVSCMMPASAAVYYTAPTGSNGNAGTLAAPFQTITGAISHMKAGDTLYVRAGTYAESFNGNIPAGTSWSAPITIAGYPGDAAPVIQPNSGPQSVFYFDGAEQYIIISGFVINSVNCSVDAIKITEGNGGSATHIMIESCTIENAYSQGILTTDGGSYNQIINNTIFNSGSGSSLSLTKSDYHGMYISTDHNLIQGNICYDNPGYGIQVYCSDGSSAHDNVVCNNFCYGNATANDGGGGGMVISSGTNNQAYNNVLYGNLVDGIDIDYSASGALIANNTVYNNGGYGIYVGTGSTNAIVENNIAYDDAWGPDLYDGGSASTTYAANLSGVNPYFANASAAQFELTSASTCAANAGVTVSSVPTDILGVSRPSGSYSIGAYQYTGTVSTSTPPPVSTSNPAPTLSGVSTTSATAGASAITVTLSGSNFISGSVAQWNGASLSTTYVSATSLTAKITSGDMKTAGTYSITVSNPSPGGGVSGAVTFTVSGKSKKR